MKLFFHPMSGNSRRALLVAAHLDLQLDKEIVDITRGEQQGAPHTSRNPNQRVPVLEDNGFVLWESRAIMQYLCDKTPGQTLLPTEPQGRADVCRWLFWCAAHMAPAATILVIENFVKGLRGAAPDPAEVARGTQLFTQFGGILDAHLAGKTWVAQDRLTLADLSIASSLALAVPARLPIDNLPNLRAWLGRVQELPAWKQTAPQR